MGHNPPLELDGAALRELLRESANKLAPFLDSLPAQPLSRLDGGRALARSLAEPPPERGEPFRRLLARVVDHIAPASLNTASPGYLAFIPGGGLPQAAVADLITGVLNRFTGLWMPAPGMVQLEIEVVRWLCSWLGYGAGSGGLLTSGGSLANFGAIVAARDGVADFTRARIYSSALAHHSVRKAAHLAGFRGEQVRELPLDEGFRLQPQRVAVAIAEDRAAGFEPLMVMAAAGTTALGTVDPLDELAALCEAEGLWLHVDGAYGGCFVLTERGRLALRGIERADSVALDPHKGLFLPYGTGALLVRDREALRRAFTVASDYLPEPSRSEDHWDFADLGPELSRPARGLRLWLPLKMHGVGAFREALDEKLDLARDAAHRVAALPHLRLVTPPTLSLFSFRIEPEGHPDPDALTRRVLARVNDRQRVFLTGASVEEQGERRFVGRVCVLSFRTHQDRIDALVEDLAAAIQEVVG